MLRKTCKIVELHNYARWGCITYVSIAYRRLVCWFKSFESLLFHYVIRYNKYAEKNSRWNSGVPPKYIYHIPNKNQRSSSNWITCLTYYHFLRTTYSCDSQRRRSISRSTTTSGGRFSRCQFNHKCYKPMRIPPTDHGHRRNCPAELTAVFRVHNRALRRKN